VQQCSPANRQVWVKQLREVGFNAGRNEMGNSKCRE